MANQIKQEFLADGKVLSVKCDVKKGKRWRIRGGVGKETPKKEMDNNRIFMTSHMALFANEDSCLYSVPYNFIK